MFNEETLLDDRQNKTLANTEKIKIPFPGFTNELELPVRNSFHHPPSPALQEQIFLYSHALWLLMLLLCLDFQFSITFVNIESCLSFEWNVSMQNNVISLFLFLVEPIIVLMQYKTLLEGGKFPLRKDTNHGKWKCLNTSNVNEEDCGGFYFDMYAGRTRGWC